MSEHSTEREKFYCQSGSHILEFKIHLLPFFLKYLEEELIYVRKEVWFGRFVLMYRILSLSWMFMYFLANKSSLQTFPLEFVCRNWSVFRNVKRSATRLTKHFSVKLTNNEIWKGISLENSKSKNRFISPQALRWKDCDYYDWDSQPGIVFNCCRSKFEKLV